MPTFPRTHLRPFQTSLAWTLTLLAVNFTATFSGACNVPVFRYALEKWQPGSFDVYVFHEGELSKTDQATIKILRDAGEAETARTNLKVVAVDLAQKPSKELLDFYQSLKTKSLPVMAALYPVAARNDTPFWTGALTPANAKLLLDSPARKAIADQVLKGTSAVWVLLKSGDKQKDEATAKLLDEQLKHLEKTLKLPQLTDDPEDKLDNKEVPLKLKFSMISLDRNDAAEAAFIEMLLNSEPGLKDDPDFCKEPMVFPIFGRGRAMFGLIGKGINEENIFDAAKFLIGPCTCKVKEQNPGFDLLMTAPWENILGDQAVKGYELPPLTGITKIKAPIETSQTRPVSFVKNEFSPFQMLQKEVAIEQAEIEKAWAESANKEPSAKIEPSSPAVQPGNGGTNSYGSVTTPSPGGESPSDSALETVLMRNTLISIIVGVAAVAAVFFFARFRGAREVK